jgi:hypothetical protein
MSTWAPRDDNVGPRDDADVGPRDVDMSPGDGVVKTEICPCQELNSKSPVVLPVGQALY